MREVCKAGLLQQKDPTPKSFLSSKVGAKKTIYLPEKLYVLCVHDDRIPFLELYKGEKDIQYHLPQKVVDLLNCSYVTQVVEDDRTFVIGFDDSEKKPLELTALSAQERHDWISMLTFKLIRLGCLPPADNTYGPLPFFDKNSNSLSNTDSMRFGSLDNPLVDLQSNLQSASLYDTLNSVMSNENREASSNDEQELYETIGQPSSSGANHRLDVRPKPNTSVRNNSSDHLPRTSVPPQLPPRIQQNRTVVIGRSASETEHDHYSLAPIYSSYPRSLSTESAYDQPSPPLPCSPPKAPSPHPRPSIAEETVASNDESHFYENEVPISITNGVANSLDGRGGYADVAYPPRPYERRHRTVSHGSAIKSEPVNYDRNPKPNSNDDKISSQEVLPKSNLFVDIDDRVEVPIAPLSAAPSLPPQTSPSTKPSSSSPSPPPVPPRNEISFTQQKTLKIKEIEVIKLKREIDSESGIRVMISMEAAIKGLALVEFNGHVWVSGWNVKYNKILSVGFHVGDKLLAIDNRPMPSTIDETRRLLNVLAFAGPVEILLKRLPHGKVFFLERDVEGKKLGLIRKKGKNEIIDVEHNSIAEKCGVSTKTCSYLNPSAPVNWYITEVNGRPISIFAKNNEAGERLAAVGLEISVVLQPLDFVKMLKKCLKQQKKNYKEFVIG